ncbi:MAG TPA: hypothetical protein VMW28_09720 [Pelolinea sp.]|nr:hypothetical protein [Pelolinea sp.]
MCKPGECVTGARQAKLAIQVFAPGRRGESKLRTGTPVTAH